jgi:uncharacterized protein (TIGR01777 family)
MKVVVAGGTGLIGRSLIASLAKDGHEIVVLSRRPSHNQSLFPNNVSFQQWDAINDGDWVSSINGAQTVVNLAGENLAGKKFLPDRWTDSKKRRVRESRVNSGRAITGAIEMAGDKPDVLIQSSAVGYYGIRGDEVINETGSAGSDFLATVQIDSENSTADVETLGVRRVISRTGLVLTTEGGPLLPRLILPFKLYGGGYFGSGKQWWSWVHIVDEVRAIRFLIENDAASGPVNVTSPNPVTNKEFGKALGRVMGRPSFVPVPGFAMRMIAGEAAVMILDGQRVVPEKLLELGFTFRFPDVEEALRDLVNQ